MREVARLGRAVHAVLQAYATEGLITEGAAESALEEALNSLNTVYTEQIKQCLCDPPGSGEEWCRGHCQPLELVEGK